MTEVGETNPVLLIGMGEVGRTIADALVEFEIGYDAIERDGARLRSAVADGYSVSYGDATDARVWRAMDLQGRRCSVLTAATMQDAADWLPSSRALFPDVHRLWVAKTDDEAEQLNELGLEAVVEHDTPRGIEAAQILLRGFGIDEAAITNWTNQQQARILTPIAA